MTPSTHAGAKASRSLLVMLVLANVCIQLMAALLLKIAPEFSIANAVWIGLVLGGVFALSVVRFWLWGNLHRHFPLSIAYPASALFFPGILAMAWYFGEPVGSKQVVGVVLVLIGVALLLTEDDTAP